MKNEKGFSKWKPHPQHPPHTTTHTRPNTEYSSSALHTVCRTLAPRNTASSGNTDCATEEEPKTILTTRDGYSAMGVDVGSDSKSDAAAVSTAAAAVSTVAVVLSVTTSLLLLLLLLLLHAASTEESQRNCFLLGLLVILSLQLTSCTVIPAAVTAA